jgi:hypothetical protein
MNEWKEDVSEFAISNRNFSEETDNKLMGTIIEWNGMSEDASKFIIPNRNFSEETDKIDRNDN